MADINYNDYGVAAALNNMAEAQQMQAMRPQKSRVYTSTTSTPRELEDMIVRRNMIGAATRELDDALKAREGYKYSLGTALAGLPQQQGPGSWLSAFARSFGAGMAAPTAAQVDRAQKKYEAEIRDLNTAIALDKAMGETQGQTQTIRYDELPYGLGGGKSGGTQASNQQIPIITPEYWDQMISNFDAARPDEASYRNQTQLSRKISNAMTFAGNKNETYARQQFDLIKGKNFLPIARNTLKGSGPITDFEDQKYTDWLNKANDPVALKDTAKMIVDDVAIRNNWTREQKADALNGLGLSSVQTQLLPQQVQYEPERVKGEKQSVDSVLKKYNAQRVDQ